MQITKNKRKCTGNALLTALFIMTLIAIAATAMLKRLSVEIARTHRFVQTDTHYLATQFVQFWALAFLENWSKPFPSAKANQRLFTFPQTLKHVYPGYTLEGHIEDLGGKINLNALKEGKMQEVFIRLLQETSPPMNKALSMSITAAIIDWTSPINSASPHNQWSQYYAKLSPPYLPAHQPMRSVFELNRVAGLSPALFKQLYPNVIALPEPTKININTASEALLKAILEPGDEAGLEAIVSARSNGKLQTKEDFDELVQSLNLDTSIVTYESNYFLSVATAKQGKEMMTVNTLIRRVPVRNQVQNVTEVTKEKWQTGMVRQTINSR